MTASAQMTIDPRFILPFESATDADHPRMGGKCASLARMIAMGVPVPRGFAVATDAYAAHLAATGLEAAIREELSHLDTHNVTDEEARSQAIRHLVTERAMPTEVETAIRAARAFRLTLCGVDLLRASEGPKVLEVNSSPGFEGIESATKKNIAARVFDAIERKVCRVPAIRR